MLAAQLLFVVMLAPQDANAAPVPTGPLENVTHTNAWSPALPSDSVNLFRLFSGLSSIVGGASTAFAGAERFWQNPRERRAEAEPPVELLSLGLAVGGTLAAVLGLIEALNAVVALPEAERYASWTSLESIEADARARVSGQLLIRVVAGVSGILYAVLATVGFAAASLDDRGELLGPAAGWTVASVLSVVAAFVDSSAHGTILAFEARPAAAPASP